MESKAIRTEKDKAVEGALEVISRGANLFVRMAFDDPNAVVQDIKDGAGKAYSMVKNSRPTVSNLEWRCFSLTEEIPLGSKFTGELVVNGATRSFEGEAVNWQPTFGVTAGKEETSSTPFKYLIWMLLPLVLILILGITTLVRNASRSGGEEQSDKSETVKKTESEDESAKPAVKRSPKPVDTNPPVMISSKPEDSTITDVKESKPVVADTLPPVKFPKSEETTNVGEPSTKPVEPSTKPVAPSKKPVASAKPVVQQSPVKPKLQARPSYEPLSDVVTIQSNGIYSITNKQDISAVREKIYNSGKSGIVLVFCPDRYEENMRSNQYQQLWRALVSDVRAYNIKEIEVIKPVNEELRVDGGLLGEKEIGFNVKELK